MGADSSHLVLEHPIIIHVIMHDSGVTGPGERGGFVFWSSTQTIGSMSILDNEQWQTGIFVRDNMIYTSRG